MKTQEPEAFSRQPQLITTAPYTLFRKHLLPFAATHAEKDKEKKKKESKAKEEKEKKKEDAAKQKTAKKNAEKEKEANKKTKEAAKKAREKATGGDECPDVVPAPLAGYRNSSSLKKGKHRKQVQSWERLGVAGHGLGRTIFYICV